MNDFPDISNIVRVALQREGLIDRDPDRAIPVRYWPDENTIILGYLDMYEKQADDGTLKYDMTFRASPLHGEPPKYDLRFDFGQPVVDNVVTLDSRRDRQAARGGPNV